MWQKPCMSSVFRLFWVVVLLGAVAVVAAPVGADLIEAGDVRTDYGVFSVVFYYAPDPMAPTRKTVAELRKEHLPDVPLIRNDEESQELMFLGLAEEAAPLAEFVLPSDDYFTHSGPGMTPADVAALRATSVATNLVFVVPVEEVWIKAQAFETLVHAFAEATGAYIWDSATRECFTRDAWQAIRLPGAATAVPDITRHITIHFYQPEEESPLLRAVTLGMEKFALPNVVVERLRPGESQAVGTLINLVCQSLVERPFVPHPARHVVRIEDIDSEAFRQGIGRFQGAHATGEITLVLTRGGRDEGDPAGPLIELGFGEAPGETLDGRRQAALAALFGATESLIAIEHDEGLLEASRRARERLPELQAMFGQGLGPGGRLLVKAPFATDDGEGNEWMWVEVTHWPESGPLVGILQNDPAAIAELYAGMRVAVGLEDVFDYILLRPDGSMEGNETGRILEERAAAVE